MRPLPVIIDTDPGLDDALALFIACASPEFDIRGVVTVAGNVGLANTTRNALRILDFVGRADIPVIIGAERPLRRPPIEAGGIHGADGLGGLDLPPPKREALTIGAVDWMVDLLRDNARGSISILALGPLTNIAALIEAAPDAAARLRSVVAMGGAVRDRGNVTPFAEFNIAADPEAADVVFRSGIPVTLAPLDLTRQVSADAAWGALVASSGGAVARASKQLVEAYLANIVRYRAARGIVEQGPAMMALHDPCVMLHLIDPGLFVAESLPLSVICNGERDGATVIDDASGAAITVLTTANKQRALDLARERISMLR